MCFTAYSGNYNTYQWQPFPIIPCTVWARENLTIFCNSNCMYIYSGHTPSFLLLMCERKTCASLRWTVINELESAGDEDESN